MLFSLFPPALIVPTYKACGVTILYIFILRKQHSMWVAGEIERARSHHHHHHYRDSDKLRKMEKQDKLDKLEKLEMMDGSDRVKHLEAQMLRKISAMDLEPKEIQLMEEEVRGRCSVYSVCVPTSAYILYMPDSHWAWNVPYQMAIIKPNASICTILVQDKGSVDNQDIASCRRFCLM